jgi:crotonobetainyl-CoA hydratase
VTDPLRTRRLGAVLEVTLDRPPANAIDAATSRELNDAFAGVGADPSVRCAIVTGSGERFFSAGWDLKAAAAGEDEDDGPGGFAGLTERFDLPTPVIAAVNGMAVGGGFELALASDLVVAVPSAEFFLPEVNLGFVADAGGILRLPARLPRAVAMEMLLTGRRMGAEEAERRGLVNRVVDRELLMSTAWDLAATIAAAAPLAVRAVKSVVDATEGMTAAGAFATMRETPAYRHMLASADAREGPAAFAEGRPPRWTGA